MQFVLEYIGIVTVVCSLFFPNRCSMRLDSAAESTFTSSGCLVISMSV